MTEEKASRETNRGPGRESGNSDSAAGSRKGRRRYFQTKKDGRSQPSGNQPGGQASGQSGQATRPANPANHSAGRKTTGAATGSAAKKRPGSARRAAAPAPASGTTTTACRQPRSRSRLHRPPIRLHLRALRPPRAARLLRIPPRPLLQGRPHTRRLPDRSLKTISRRHRRRRHAGANQHAPQTPVRLVRMGRYPQPDTNPAANPAATEAASPETRPADEQKG